MVESDRSRSPRRQIQKPDGTIDQPCQSELGRSLETLWAAADRLLQFQLDGYSIPQEALSKCTALLKSARATAVEGDQLQILLHHNQLAKFLNSKMLCELSAASRQFSDSFRRLSDNHRRMFHSVLPVPIFRVGDLLHVQSWQYHSSFMMNILNGNSEAVEFIVQLGVDVNQVEEGHDEISGCEMCYRSSSVLLRYTFWEVADAMATSRSPSRSPSARRLSIRDALRRHGGSSTRRLKSKKKLLQHLCQPWEHESCRCMLVDQSLIEDSDDNLP